jgi:hypothetical protein
MKQIFIIFTSILFATLTATAQSSGSQRPWLLSQSAAAKEAKRFTLQEWLENKQKRNMMDMWLAINTPTPYEFVIGGSLQSYTLETTSGGVSTSESKTTLNGEFSAYAKFVGLSLEHTNNTQEKYSDLTGIFNLRVFGDTVQGTHLTLHYGLRTRTGYNSQYRLNQAFPAITLQLYLMKYFGIQGNYRSFGSTTEDFYGDTTADELTYGAFIEYGALRLFGDIYQEKQNSKLNGVETNYIRGGSRIGLKLYF